MTTERTDQPDQPAARSLAGAMAGEQPSHMPPLSPLGQWALYYGNLGAPVLPCQPGDKRPLGALVPHGLNDASNDPKRIEHWWRQCPDANIGLRTGNGVFVLDLDGEQGFRSCITLQERFGHLPPTVTSLTGSGGYHVFYRTPIDRSVPNSAGKLGEKLDVRGDGGYVIAPPSLHPSGCHYVFQKDCEPWSMAFAAAPDWLLQLVAPPPRPSVMRPTTQFDAGGTCVSDAYVAGALRRGIEQVARASEGCRNVTLNNQTLALSRFVRAGALNAAELIAALIAAGLAAGLGQHETERKSPAHYGLACNFTEGLHTCPT